MAAKPPPRLQHPPPPLQDWSTSTPPLHNAAIHFGFALRARQAMPRSGLRRTHGAAHTVRRALVIQASDGGKVCDGNGACSGVGKVIGSPYTEPLEANAILETPLARIASTIHPANTRLTGARSPQVGSLIIAAQLLIQVACSILVVGE